MAENRNSYMFFNRKNGIKEITSISTLWLREFSVKTDFKEIGRQCVDWINLALNNGN
jgi:hypothetical protein